MKNALDDQRISLRVFFTLAGALIGASLTVITSAFFLGSRTSEEVQARIALEERVTVIEQRVPANDAFQRGVIEALAEIKTSVKYLERTERKKGY